MVIAGVCACVKKHVISVKIDIVNVSRAISASKSEGCENSLVDAKVSSLIDSINMLKTFQMGISLGCTIKEPKLLLASVAAIFQVCSAEVIPFSFSMIDSVF